MRRLAIISLALMVLALPLLGHARDFTPKECPVIGNKDSGIYHMPGGTHYHRMLQENMQKDNRVCFPNEQAAKAAGYRKSKT